MAAVSIKTNFPEVQRELTKLERSVFKKAVKSTLNKTVAKSKTTMSKEITKTYNIRSGEVKPKLKTQRVRSLAKSATARLFSNTKVRFNLIRFMERSVSLAQARIRRRTGDQRTLRVKVLKRGGFKRVPGAFIINGRTIVQRKSGTTMPSRARYAGTKHAEKLEALTTVGIPQMFNTRRINDKVLLQIRAELPRRFEQDVKFYTDKFNRA